MGERFRGVDRSVHPTSLQHIVDPAPLGPELFARLSQRLLAASDRANRTDPTSDPGRSIAPKEETMNPQHQDEDRER